MPADALVHASVYIYLRAHPEYWRRLPAQVVGPISIDSPAANGWVRAAEALPAGGEHAALVAAAS